MSPSPSMAHPHAVSVALLRPLAELLGRLGEAPTTFLAALGIDDATAPESFVAGDQVDAALAEIATRRGDPAFALTLAHAALTRPLGLFGHLVWLSGTVRDALTRAVRFYAVVTRRSTLLLDEGLAGVATLRALRTARSGRILSEFPFASFALRARDATGGVLAVRAVRFTHDGESTAAYLDVFGVPVTFGAAHDELELDAAQLDLPLASADPLTSAAIEETVARLTTATSPRSPFADKVRQAAVARAGAASLATIAEDLAMSERTLRRQLAREGRTLRELTDDVQRERADALLAAGSSVKETAFALGFSEPSAFSRAYLRWTGTRPRALGTVST